MAPARGFNYSTNLSSASEHQVATTNSTLNTLFGGRQRSWMLNTQQVHPRPRTLPPAPKPPVVHGQPLTQASRYDQGLQSGPEVQLYLTTPASGPVTQVAVSTAPSQLLPEPQNSLPTVAPTATVPSISSTVLPSPSPSDVPSPAVSGSTDALCTTSHQSYISEPVTGTSTIELQPIPNGVPNPEATLTSASAPSIITVSAPSGTSTGRSSGGRHEAMVIDPAAMNLPTPPTPSVRTFSPTRMPSGLSQNPENPAKRQRTGPSPAPAPALLLHSLQAVSTIDSHVSRYGGINALEESVERPRFMLLRDACVQNDLFFVALHQIFCAWSINRRKTHELCLTLGYNSALIDSGLGLISTILKSNLSVRAEHLDFFAHFPRHLDVICSDPGYGSSITAALDFCIRISQYWTFVTHDHKRLGYPLLMDELLSTFGLYSPILQTIIFRASRRALGIQDGEIGFAVDELFRQDQIAHHQGNGLYFMRTTKDFHRDTANASLIRKYQSLYARLRIQYQSMQTQSPQMSFQQQDLQPTRQSQAVRTPQTSPQILQRPNKNPTPSVDAAGGFALGSCRPSIASNAGGDASMTWPISPQLPVGSSIETQAQPAPVPSQYQLSSTQLPPLQTLASPSTTRLPSQPNTPTYTSPYMNYTFAQVGNHAGGQSRVDAGQPQLVGPASHQGPPPQTLQQVYPAHTPQQAPYSPIQMTQAQNIMGTASQAPASRRTLSISAQASFDPHGQPQPGVYPPPSAQLPGQGVSYASVANQVSTNRIATQQMPPSTPQCQPSSLTRANNANPKPVMQHQTQQAALTINSDTWLLVPQIPLRDYPSDPYEKKSVMSALHQAHLRSPRRIPEADAISSVGERYYQAVKYLALPPTAALPHAHLYQMKFFISGEETRRLVKDHKFSRDMLPVSHYWDGSLRMRLRCCLLKRGTASIAENEWVTTDTEWPQHVFMRLNAHPLTIRRRQHYSKDQPVEVGAYVVPGENKLEVNIPPLKPNLAGNKVPFLAVEVIETLRHTSLLALPNLGLDVMIPLEETRDTIVKRLAGSSSRADDDDFAMVVSDLTIDIRDPFSFSMWTTPVRGRNCSHLECFDLDHWLNTRPGKKSCICGSKESECTLCPKEPTFADKWKCPICSGDARPYSLRIDGFLLSIREQLAAEGKLNAKSIVVSADGSWMPVVEEGDDDDGLDSDDDRKPAAGRPSSAKAVLRTSLHKPPVEVVVLDDD